MTMVKPLFLPTPDAVEQSYMLSSAAFNNVINYSSCKFTPHHRHAEFNKQLVDLKKTNLEVKSKLKVAVGEIVCLNNELRYLLLSQKDGAATPITKVAPQGGFCDTKTIAALARLPKQ